MNNVQSIAARFLSAHSANERYEAPSAVAMLDMDEAHAVQRAFNALRGERDSVAGFKSAANAEALQRALGLSGPIIGMLFASGERAVGSTLRRADYRTLLIETELGFRTARRITAPVKSLAELRAATTTCAPMIELADPGFDRTRMTGTDLIAANAASAGYIGGPRASVADLNVNDIRVTLSRDGEPLHQARSGDLMGDQWEALKWLVNRVVEVGYVIEAGHLLMTGALGAAQPGAPGKYSADYGALGLLEFEVI